jgi:hypothetical protein
MKHMFVAALFLPVVASAQPTEEQCIVMAGALSVAASARDSNVSPKEAFAWAKGAAHGKLDDATIKKVVNAAYFDPRFALASTPEFTNQFAIDCAHPKQWQPLK